jgi:hypothetical protein
MTNFKYPSLSGLSKGNDSDAKKKTTVKTKQKKIYYVSDFLLNIVVIEDYNNQSWSTM